MGFIFWLRLTIIYQSTVYSLTEEPADVSNYEADQQDEFVEVEDVSQPTNEDSEPTEEWMQNVVVDIAYYLRRQKYFGIDVRFKSTRDKSIPDFYLQFPEPTLRNIHYKVRRRCDNGFIDCIKYLHSVIERAILTRKSKGFNLESGRSIKEMNAECKKLLANDYDWFEEFRNPLDRFQWLTSASYYMCWHTMRHHAALTFFNEPCDNFASCLDDNGKFANGDIRANDNIPFACAKYSFCPDPCCSNRILKNIQECTNTPCRSNECSLNPEENRDWDSLVLNYWNVSCPCEEKGTVWDSKSGLCVDMNECAEKLDDCKDVENCVNMPGGFFCGCDLGYMNNENTNQCQKDPYLWPLLYGDLPEC